jgi:hypothetical protein
MPPVAERSALFPDAVATQVENLLRYGTQVRAGNDCYQFGIFSNKRRFTTPEIKAIEDTFTVSAEQ